MIRTISQLIYDLLDKEGGRLPATEIAERLGINRGTACSARDRWWKKNKPVQGRVVDVKVPSAKKVAPTNMKYKLEFVDLASVPGRQRVPGAMSIWNKIFNDIPEGKAAVRRFDTRNEASRVRVCICSASIRLKIPISTRIFYAAEARHVLSGWLLYFWKREVKE